MLVGKTILILAASTSRGVLVWFDCTSDERITGSLHEIRNYFNEVLEMMCGDRQLGDCSVTNIRDCNYSSGTST